VGGLEMPLRVGRRAIAKLSGRSKLQHPDSSQFDDKETGVSFMRVSFESEADVIWRRSADGFADAARPFEWPIVPRRGGKDEGFIKWFSRLGIA